MQFMTFRIRNLGLHQMNLN